MRNDDKDDDDDGGGGGDDEDDDDVRQRKKSERKKVWAAGGIALTLLAASAIGFGLAWKTRWLHCNQLPITAHLSACTQKDWKRDVKWRNGDILLVSGQRSRDKFIHFVSGGPFNHVAIVYVQPASGEPYVWEMLLTGTRLISLCEFVRSHRKRGSRLAYRQLEGEGSGIPSETMERIVAEQWSTYYDVDLPLHLSARFLQTHEFIGELSGKLSSTKNNKRLSCAQLVYRALAAANIIDPRLASVPAQSLLPIDFASEPLDDRLFVYRPSARCRHSPLLSWLRDS